MEAKKKALELIEKFYEINDKEVSQATNPYISRQYTVLCALVAVDNTIDETEHYQDIVGMCMDDTHEESVIERLNYWEQVKEELLKL